MVRPKQRPLCFRGTTTPLESHRVRHRAACQRLRPEIARRRIRFPATKHPSVDRVCRLRRHLNVVGRPTPPPDAPSPAISAQKKPLALGNQGLVGFLPAIFRSPKIRGTNSWKTCWRPVVHILETHLRGNEFRVVSGYGNRPVVVSQWAVLDSNQRPPRCQRTQNPADSPVFLSV